MLSLAYVLVHTMIGSCSADFATGVFPALLDAVGFTLCRLCLFVRGFVEIAVFVAAVDRVETFALIALMAGGGLGEGTAGVLVRVEARVAGADAFARPAMVRIRVRVGRAFVTRRDT